MDDYALEQVCKSFLGMGIQDWGQSPAKREAATREYVRAAGLMFGSNEANEWLKGVLRSLQRGKFETEVQQLVDALKARQALSMTAAEGKAARE